MKLTPEKLSAGEFEILKILWKLDSATVAEVRDGYALEDGSRPAYTTTMTVLSRLVDKDAVRVDKNKQPFRYRPAHRRSRILCWRLRDFVGVSYEGDAELLLEHLLSEGHLSAVQARAVLHAHEPANESLEV